MFCVQCGYKLEDGHKFCPKCGRKLDDAFENSDTSLEDIILKVMNMYPSGSSMVISELSRLTGLSKLQVGYLVAYARDGNDLKKLKDYQSMEKKYKSQSSTVSSPCCPKCGSSNVYILGKEPDRSTTVSYISGIYDTTYKAGRYRALCRNCGKRWKI